MVKSRVYCPEKFCMGVESLLVIEIGKSGLNKMSQARDKKRLFNPYAVTNSGIVYFREQNISRDNLSNLGLSFCAQYDSIPKDLILDRYSNKIKKSRIKMPNFLEKMIARKESDKIFQFIRDENHNDKFSSCVGKLCELIAMEDLRRIPVGNICFNRQFEDYIKKKAKYTEIDVIVSGKRKMYEKVMKGLKDKEHLSVVYV